MSVFIENRDIIEVGENIRKRREMLGISQNALGVQVESNGNAIHLYESGKQVMRVDKLLQIADALKTTPMQILPKRCISGYDTDPRMNRIMELSKKLTAEEQNDFYRIMEDHIFGMLYRSSHGTL